MNICKLATKGFEDRTVIVLLNNFPDKVAKMTVNIEGSVNYKIKGNRPIEKANKVVEVQP